MWVFGEEPKPFGARYAKAQEEAGTERAERIVELWNSAGRVVDEVREVAEEQGTDGFAGHYKECGF